MSEDDKGQNNIIPIGKYKGQPVEVLQGDPAYTDWLTAQSWFRERYAGLFQIIVNNFQEPAETPEHNRLQARFLEPAFCRALMKRLGREVEAARLQPVFEVSGWDVVIHDYRLAIEIKPVLADDFPAVLRQIRAQHKARTGFYYETFENYRAVLVIDRFMAEGATLDQVRQMFGFPIVTFAEIEAGLAEGKAAQKT
jgi:hypothetical protein